MNIIWHVSMILRKNETFFKESTVLEIHFRSLKYTTVTRIGKKFLATFHSYTSDASDYSG